MCNNNDNNNVMDTFICEWPFNVIAGQSGAPLNSRITVLSEMSNLRLWCQCCPAGAASVFLQPLTTAAVRCCNCAGVSISIHPSRNVVEQECKVDSNENTPVEYLTVVLTCMS